MDVYNVDTPDEEYKVSAQSKNKARKEVLEKEGITLEKVELEEYGDTKGDWIYLEQDDKRWANEKIGDSNATIGGFGCLITNLSSLSYWYGKYFTPKEIAEKGKFTYDGSYYWKSGDSFLPFDFVWRYYTRDFGKIKEILFSEDNACVVRVSLGGAYHWLAVIGFDSKTNKLIGADPLTGDSCFIEERYGRINGFAEVTRNNN
ncbi:MAG: hypothetical protein PF542_06480 [Nanoarchaeota archaeon]|jgi:hypothetical protein|nr:hypothetical protein [Nanoarchaeota archaeon]